MASEKIRNRILDAFLKLGGEKDFDDIGLREIAAEADASLGELRALYDGKIDILAGVMRRIDSAVLDSIGEPDGEETSRDRLFEIVMRRLDILAPHRAAVERLQKAVRRDPGLALHFNRIALDTARFMLAAAGIRTAGLHGLAREQGFVLMMARVLPVWFDDPDPDLARTMAALDRALDRAVRNDRRAGKVIRRLCRGAEKFAHARRCFRHRRRRGDSGHAADGEAEGAPAG